jgi:hypothetical protein
MPFLKLDEDELRSIAKRSIETLEFWLRRIIDSILVAEYGDGYWEKVDGKGNYLINKSIRDSVSMRKERDPQRFARWIDASVLENQVDILCRPDFYDRCFKACFSPDFISSAHLRLVLGRLAEPRNRLAHANPISVRQAEQVVCYSNDVIDSIKKYYVTINKGMDFNAPTIVFYSDSYGNSVDLSISRGGTPRWGFDFRDSVKFRPGDRVGLYVQVDSSFDRSEYSIQWTCSSSEIIGEGERLEFEFREKDVGSLFVIRAIVKSNKSWHRHGYYDDEMAICCTVLPPLE